MSKTTRAVIGLSAVVVQIVIIVWMLVLIVPAVVASGHGVTYIFLILASVVVQTVIRSLTKDD